MNKDDSLADKLFLMFALCIGTCISISLLTLAIVMMVEILGML